MILYASLIIIGLLIVQDVFLLISLLHSEYVKKLPEGLNYFPQLAVFVPARNEETHLPTCLEALAALDYPAENIEFFIGDDDSSDATLGIISTWASVRKNRHAVRLKPIDDSILNGKAIALHEMVKRSNADFYLFTDADCQVPPSWATQMVSSYKIGAGMVTGTTKIRSDTWFGNMQACDWWLSLGMVKVMADLGINLTAMGNNMMIEKSAYNVVGGFGAVAYSVTEDLALSQKMAATGYRPIHWTDPGLLVTTKPEPTFLALMRQRKRWAKGALSLPLVWKILLFLQVAFFPAIVILLVYFPLIGTLSWILKGVIQSLLLTTFAARTETKLASLNLLTFECYYAIVGCSTVLYYFWPSKIQWKDRYYA